MVGGTGEIFSLSGILKLIESAILIAAIILHRVGDNGRYLFFGSTSERLAWVINLIDWLIKSLY